ncbi:MAG TPA: acetolactate synthase small subunit [Chloroflexi bacterium]|nr:acetolactate synthase small subunit [Chloroflexota bacterium]|tara:strand:- start:5889 stop:6413 length:525 start_codon:yes stop_codon:yes gene_type:complete
MIHTIVAYVENKPGVLNRVASLFRRRGFNIESLAVGHTNLPGVSRMTIMINAEEDTDVAKRIESNLYKLVNVLRVDDLTNKSPVARELALIKVKANSKTRNEIIQIADIFRANIVDAASHSLVLEISGTVEKVSRLVLMLEPFNIIELQRTGVIAIERGSHQIPSEPPSLNYTR